MPVNSDAFAVDALDTILRLTAEINKWQSEARRLRTSRDRLIDFMSTASDVLWETNAEMKVVSGQRVVKRDGCPAAFTPMDQRLANTFQGKTTLEALGEDPARIPNLKEWKQMVKARKPYRGFQYSLCLPDNTLLWMESNGNPIFNEDGSFAGYRGTSRDITRRKEDEALIGFLARHDALTNLPNRVLFHERVAEALARSDNGEVSGVAVLSLDLDRFKRVNDTLGHGAGDALLKIVADRLSTFSSENVTVARLGGDEFAVAQASFENGDEIALLAHRIAERVGEPCDIDGHRVEVKGTVGIALAPLHGTTSDELLSHADIALYRAKLDEPGTWRFFEPEMAIRLESRRVLEFDMREALERGEFELYYQPLYNVSSREIVAFEALLRWMHPVRGTVQPDAFIPLAEENGMIEPIGQWVLETACKEAAKWPGHIHLAVNLSPVQFKNPNLVSVVRRALADSGLSGKRLELEITEAVLLLNSATTLATLHELRDLGARISLDDFGTGYSSLSYLRNFPFDKIKIDRSFIRDLTGSTGPGVTIIRAITGLGSSLSLPTTAEGVETSEQMAILSAEGCTEVQGYLFSESVPAGEIAGLLSQEIRRPKRSEQDRAELETGEEFALAGMNGGGQSIRKRTRAI